MPFFSIEISDVFIEIISDSVLYKPKNIDLFKTDSESPIKKASIQIENFQIQPESSSDLNGEEKRALLKTVHFPFRWLSNQMFGYTSFREAALKCIDDPAMFHIALNWNRAIVRNYAENIYSLFYPIDKRDELKSLLFIARLRSLVGNVFPNFDSVMIHGASILFGYKAAVFLAPDEGGKSTLIKKSEGKKILSDDHIVLEKRGDEITIHATPFGELTDGPAKGKLAGFFLLEKSENFSIEKIDPEEILQFIWNDQFVKWYQYPKSLRVKIFDIINYASRSTPIYRLKIPRNHIDWGEVEKRLK